jgi:hypothetical protein
MLRAILALVMVALAAAPALAQTGLARPQTVPPSSSPSTPALAVAERDAVTVHDHATVRHDVAGRPLDGIAEQSLVVAGHGLPAVVVLAVGVALAGRAVGHAAAAAGVVAAEPAGGPAARSRLSLTIARAG